LPITSCHHLLSVFARLINKKNNIHSEGVANRFECADLPRPSIQQDTSSKKHKLQHTAFEQKSFVAHMSAAPWSARIFRALLFSTTPQAKIQVAAHSF